MFVNLQVRELIRDCFVTGKWKESEDAAELLRLDAASDDELFGDFEDLETGDLTLLSTRLYGRQFRTPSAPIQEDVVFSKAASTLDKKPKTFSLILN